MVKIFVVFSEQSPGKHDYMRSFLSRGKAEDYIKMWQESEEEVPVFTKDGKIYFYIVEEDIR